MPLRIVRFVAILLTTLMFAMTFCHVLEIPGKLRLAPEEWLVVQHNLYAAFGIAGGAVYVATIVAAWALAWLVRGRRPASWLSAFAAVCVTASLAEWFIMVSPMNAALAEWTPATIPADWTAVRDQWETGHAIGAVLNLAALSAQIVAVLAETPDGSRPSA